MGKIRVQWYIEAVRCSCRRASRKPLCTGNTSFISRFISVATARWWHKFFSIPRQTRHRRCHLRVPFNMPKKKRTPEGCRSFRRVSTFALVHECKIQRRIKGPRFFVYYLYTSFAGRSILGFPKLTRVFHRLLSWIFARGTIGATHLQETQLSRENESRSIN